MTTSRPLAALTRTLRRATWPLGAYHRRPARRLLATGNPRADLPPDDQPSPLPNGMAQVITHRFDPQNLHLNIPRRGGH